MRKRATLRRFLNQRGRHDLPFVTLDFIGRSPTCETPDTIGRHRGNTIFQPAETQPAPLVKSRVCSEMAIASFCEMRFSCPFLAPRGSEEIRSKKSRAHVT